MRKIILFLGLLMLYSTAFSQVTWPDSSWNRKNLNSNVFIKGGLVSDSSIIAILDVQGDTIRALAAVKYPDGTIQISAASGAAVDVGTVEGQILYWNNGTQTWETATVLNWDDATQILTIADELNFNDANTGIQESGNNLAITSDTTTFSGDIAPDITNSNDLGSGSLQFQNTYTQKIYPNSTTSYLTASGNDTLQLYINSEKKYEFQSDSFVISPTTIISGTTSQLILPLSDDASTPTLAFGDGNTGFYESADNTLRLSMATTAKWQWQGNEFQGTASAAPRLFNTTSTATVPNICPKNNDANTGIGSLDQDILSLIAGGVEGIRITEATTIDISVAGDVAPSATNTHDLGAYNFYYDSAFIGDALISGNLTVTGSISGGIYGTQGFADSAYVLPITEDIFTPITNLNNNLYVDGIEVGDLVFTGDSIQVVTAGNYEINWDISCKGATTDDYIFSIFVDNVRQTGKGGSHRDMTGTTIGSVSGHTILTIGANEWISLRISNTANSNDVTLVSGNIVIEKK